MLPVVAQSSEMMNEDQLVENRDPRNCVARLVVMIQIAALRSRLENSQLT
jgi:hypothetical protein